MIKGGVESRDESDRIESLADACDGLGGEKVAAVGVFRGPESACQAVPGTPVLRKGGQGVLEGLGGEFGLLGVVEEISTLKPPVAGVTRGFKPRVQERAGPRGFARVEEGVHKGFTGGDVIGMGVDDGLKFGKAGVAFRVGCAWLGGDSGRECDAGINVIWVGLDPAREGGACDVVGDVGQECEGELFEERLAIGGGNGVVGVPAEGLGIESAVLDAEDFEQEPPGFGVSGFGGRGEAEAAFSLGGEAQSQAGAGFLLE